MLFRSNDPMNRRLDSSTDTPSSHRMIEVVNDPRVSGFLRFLNVLTGGITLAAVLALGSTAASWQANIQRLTFLVEQLSTEVKANKENDNNQDERLRELEVRQKVAETLGSTYGWRISRIERLLGK